MKVFVFGGTQFIGRATVDALLEEGHEVVLFNRGRTKNPFTENPKVTHVACDRMGERQNFREAIRKQGHCDAVIDFIGFQEPFVQDAIHALKTSHEGHGAGMEFATKHYIFISTDCVYWVQKVPIVDDRVREEDATDFSPAEFEAHLKHCQRTSVGEYQTRYGSNKLGCERALEEARSCGLCYTVLRLPDVYGPYDNLGGFWEIVTAVEKQLPIPTRLSSGRMRFDAVSGSAIEAQRPDACVRRFSWAFVNDVCRAILACLRSRERVDGMTLNIAHEEVTSLHETAGMVADTLNVDRGLLRFDTQREAALPSTDFGCLDVALALRLLRPWRPTPMRQAVQQSVRWFLSHKDHRRYHRLVHREPRCYDSSGVKRFTCRTHEVPSMWVASLAPDHALESPVVLADSFPNFTGQAVLNFMRQLMDHAGEADVQCEVQHRGQPGKVEHCTHALRYFAGTLLPQSAHGAAVRTEAADVLAESGLARGLQSPLEGLRSDLGRDLEPQPSAQKGAPPRRLHIGGPGAHSTLRRWAAGRAGAAASSAGFWDVALLGRRRWRLFPPETCPEALCCADDGTMESPVDTFVLGPEDRAIHDCHEGFSPPVCWEYEQTMGDAVVVPHGWWYQTYDDDRTLSVSAWYGPALHDPGMRAEGSEFEIVD